MPSIVSIKGVAKGYVRGKQRVEVLRGIDLEVEQGEFLALMGPSGSGKTTLLNLIGGLDRPDRGTIAVAGERLEALSQGQLTKWRARHVGFIFQFYNSGKLYRRAGARDQAIRCVARGGHATSLLIIHLGADCDLSASDDY